MPILPANIDSLGKIVEDKQAYKLRWTVAPKAIVAYVDVQTAYAVVTAYNMASDDTKARMRIYIRERGPRGLAGIARIVWSAVPRAVAIFMVCVGLSGCAATQPQTVRDMVRADCGVPDMNNVAAYVDCANITLDAIDMQTRIEGFTSILEYDE